MSERQVLAGGMMICAVMIVVVLIRLPKRGDSVFALGGAFAALGFALYARMQEWPAWTFWTGLSLVAVGIAGDIVLRNRKQA